MIPKTIHYCWFGRGPKSPLILQCIESWKKYCPDYQIIEWNETNFDIEQNQYVKEAYEKKKWAFVSDYVRLVALYKMGGVYLDTDCELLQNIDSFLEEDGVVTGYQEEVSIPAALMIASKENPWIKVMIDYYLDRHFVNSNGKMDLTTNSSIITALSIKRFGFEIGDEHIPFGNVKLYPTVYFAPIAKKKKSGQDKNLSVFVIDPERTYAIHYGTATWKAKTFGGTIKAALVRVARLLVGPKVYTRIKARILRKKYLKMRLD